MSEPVQVRAASAAEINAHAAAWLRRRHLGNWMEQDEAELEAWLAESPANRIGYWRLSASWSRMDRLAALQPSLHQQDGVAHKGISPLWLRVAAALVVATMLAAGAGFWFAQPRATTYATALGERKAIALADGSRIELNTDTTIRLSANANARTVNLERGEVYFEIKHDPHRLFVVVAGDHRVTDVGTQFFVRREKEHLEVALVEGRARFDMPVAQSQLHSMSLAAGDVVVASARRTTLKREPIEEISSELSWRRGVLVFKHATLGEAAAEFNRYNPEKIVVADAGAARLTLNGTFKTNDVAAFTDAAHAVFGLQVDVRNGQIVISH
ncbi:MAG TPA: FecR domain-containing protein [Rhizomicrobium sp.]|nr:FecR domain-containing protein [Rhizomicrobium sp.]